MAICRIRQLGDPILRESCAPVENWRDALPVPADLRDTLHEFQRTHGFGRGIAAVQIGFAARVIFIEMEGQPFCFINPRFEFLSDEKFTLWDDCFSFPDLLVRVERSTSARVSYTDESGETQTLEVRRAFAELLQHEVDHLDGILAIDRAAGENALCTRGEYNRRY
jgi:peptide deformylase